MTRPLPTHAAKLSSRGFTLVELAVVVVVLSVLIGIAALRAPDDGAQALELAEIQVRDALQLAQARAMATRVPHGVAFDTGGERFAVVDQSGTLVVDPLVRSGYVVDFTRPEQPADLDIDTALFGDTAKAAIFDGQGVPVSGGTLLLRCRGHVVTLVFDAATGFLTAQ